MPRIKRTEGEHRRVGFPSASDRLELLEGLVVKLLSGIDRATLETHLANMDKIDIDFPDFSTEN